jgi:hypothetical protein
LCFVFFVEIVNTGPHMLGGGVKHFAAPDSYMPLSTINNPYWR